MQKCENINCCEYREKEPNGCGTWTDIWECDFGPVVGKTEPVATLQFQRGVMPEVGCTCQICKRKYTVDILVPDETWETIRPTNGGLMCGSCIMLQIEAQSSFDAWILKKA